MGIIYEEHLNVTDDSCPPCLQSGTIKVLHVSDDNDGEVLDTLLIMLETQSMAHMFGGTCDHKLLDHWAEGPSGGLKAYQRSPPQELE